MELVSVYVGVYAGETVGCRNTAKFPVHSLLDGKNDDNTNCVHCDSTPI